MTSDDVLDEFRAAGALREGHFVLSSGLHSPVFLQKNLVFMDAGRCARLCKALAEKIVAAVGPVDVAISPAVGGIIPGYETARWLKVPSMYVVARCRAAPTSPRCRCAPSATGAPYDRGARTGVAERPAVDQ